MVIDTQLINNICAYLNNQQESQFDSFLQLIPLLPAIDVLIQPIGNALKFYAKISSYYIQQLQQDIVAIPIFMFGLQLAL